MKEKDTLSGLQIVLSIVAGLLISFRWYDGNISQAFVMGIIGMALFAINFRVMYK